MELKVLVVNHDEKFLFQRGSNRDLSWIVLNNADVKYMAQISIFFVKFPNICQSTVKFFFCHKNAFILNHYRRVSLI